MRIIHAGGRSSRSWRSGGDYSGRSALSYGRGVSTGRGGGDIGRGGEEGRTRGLKLSPPQFLAMLGLGRRWRGWRGYLLFEKGMK